MDDDPVTPRQGVEVIPVVRGTGGAAPAAGVSFVVENGVRTKESSTVGRFFLFPNFFHSGLYCFIVSYTDTACSFFGDCSL